MCDVFHNLDRMHEVHVPVMMVHSANDEMIDLEHGKRLCNEIPEQFRHEPWWHTDCHRLQHDFVAAGGLRKRGMPTCLMMQDFSSRSIECGVLQ